MKLYIMNTTPLLHMLKRACALLEISRKAHVEEIKLDSKKVQSIGAGLLLLYELYQREEERELEGGSMSAEPIMVEAENVICLLESLPAEKLALLQEKAACRNEENGKPYFADSSNGYLSISHSEEYAVCAFSEMPLGVDIQKIKKIDREKVAKRLLHPAEPVNLYEDETLFFTYWAIKEAYVKKTGQGLSKDFRELFVSFLDDRTGCVKDEKTKENAKMHLYHAPDGYVLVTVS